MFFKATVRYYSEYVYDDKNNLTIEKDEQGKYIYYIYDSEKKDLIKKAQH